MSFRRVSFHTLGCKVNFSESSTLAREFEREGFERVSGSEASDICIINSCSVTENSDKKCRNLIRRLNRQNPNAIIAVTGCYAQLRGEEIAKIEGVDIVLSNNDKGEMLRQVERVIDRIGRDGHAETFLSSCATEEIKNFFVAASGTDRTRCFLKVQDGCDYKCSYCTIHYARGASRNAPISEIVEQAKQVAAKGAREIVITGINTGDFGRSTGEKFIDLLRALDKVEGIDRYRISSIEPNLLSDEIIAFCAESSKFQNHFHIPLQSGSNRVLGLMRRRYTREKFAERLQAVRRMMGDVFFGIDVIVGFPSESEEDFEQTYNLLKELSPAYLHIFPFSSRRGTPAADLDGHIEPSVMSERVARLEALNKELHTKFMQAALGQTVEVLFESTVKDGSVFGYTNDYRRVRVKYDKSLINKLVRVKINSVEMGESADLAGSVEEIIN